jgi:hypothetical protein
MTASVVLKLTELAKLSDDPDEIQGFNPRTFDYEEPKAHRVKIDQKYLNELILVLSSLPWLKEFEGGVAKHTGASSSTIVMESFAHWLLAQTRMHSAQVALDLLHEIIHRNSEDLFDVVPVWGFSPRQSIDLGHGLTIVPVELLPKSRLKEYFLRVERHRFSNELAHMHPQPGAALIKISKLGPIYEPRTSRAAKAMRMTGNNLIRAMEAQGEQRRRLFMALGEKSLSEQANSPASIFEEAEDLLAVMALICPNPIFALGQWYQRPDYLPIVAGMGSFGWPRNEHPFNFPIEKHDYDCSNLASLVNNYRELPLDTKKRLKTPLARLNMARMQLAHRTIEPAAMDLGIAAESLLTQDRDSDAPISYLLRVRGALLMGGSADERRNNYRILRDIYNLRSKVAHNGALAEPLKFNSTAAARKHHDEIRSSLEKGMFLCRSMMRKVIESGKFPIWDDLLLGIEQ